MNEQLFNDSIRYAIFLERYKNGAVRRIDRFLLDLDIAIAEQLADRLSRLTEAERQQLATRTTATTSRLKALREWLQSLQKEARQLLQDRIEEELTPLAARKVNHVERAVAQTVSVTALARPSIDRIERALRTNPFNGNILSQFTSDWSDRRMERVLQQVRVGLALGENEIAIRRRLIGTKARGFNDGVLKASRRGAEMLARTAHTHIVAQADNEIATANKDLIRAVVWTSVLDSRTSDICRVNDGKEFKPDRDLTGILPAHPNCRSFWTYRFKRQGGVVSDITYNDWLKQQPKEIVLEALGPTRTRLFLEGGLDPKQLVNAATGTRYTLDELATREEAAFAAAGL